MEEKRSFKRFDLFSVLAGIGILLVLLFESFFIFELYEANLFWKKDRPVPPPSSVEPAPAGAEEVVPVG